MKPILLYLLQVIVCSGLLYGYYHLFLRNKKFHQYNRYYLLAAIVISILVPFLNIPVYFNQEEQQPVWIQTLAGISYPTEVIFARKSSATHFFTWQNILLGTYLLAGLVILARFVVALMKVKKLIRKYEVEKLDNIYFVNTEEKGTPFSFFKWMFWNKKIAVQSESGQQIFRHELFHIQQKHSWDIVFAEAVTIIFWINPFFHLIKKELTTIHEFLADQFAVTENKQWDYAELLLMQLLGSPNMRLTHPFFHNQIKRRIAMITSSKQPKYRYLRKVLVLPLLAIIAALFAFTYKQQQERQALKEKVSDGLLLKQVSPPDTPRSKTITGGTYTISADDDIRIILTRKDEKGAKLFILNGNLYTREELIKEKGEQFDYRGELSITPANDPAAIKKYGPRAKDGVVEIRTDTDEKGRSVLVEKTLFDKVPVEVKKEPIIVVDNIIVEYEDRKILDAIVKPNDIKSVTVLKDKSATDLYGPMGANGVILIDTKNKLDLKISAGVDTVKKIKLEELKILKEKMVTLQPVVEEEKPKMQLDEVVVTGHASSSQPQFPGGPVEWRKFLQRTLKANTPVDNGAPEGEYKVKVRFVVSAEGVVSDITPLTTHGYGMEQEVVRVIKEGPNWIPAQKNGKPVTAYREQPATFIITSDTDEEEKKLQEVVVTGYAKTSKWPFSDIEKMKALPPYPNPSKNTVIIPYSSTKEGPGEVRVYDMMGKLIMTTKNNWVKGLNNVKLDISSLAKGMYGVAIVDGDRPVMGFKIVKE